VRRRTTVRGSYGSGTEDPREKTEGRERIERDGGRE
jgi:hypothetical protein